MWNPSQKFALSCVPYLYIIHTSLINRRTLGFGRCIEHVEMERPGVGQATNHDIIMFMSAKLRDQAMFQETAAFFKIDGHNTWVQLLASIAGADQSMYICTAIYVR